METESTNTRGWTTDSDSEEDDDEYPTKPYRPCKDIKCWLNWKTFENFIVSGIEVRRKKIILSFEGTDKELQIYFYVPGKDFLYITKYDELQQIKGRKLVGMTKKFLGQDNCNYEERATEYHYHYFIHTNGYNKHQFRVITDSRNEEIRFKWK